MADLISRQAAIDALHMHLMYRMGTDSNKKRLDDWINGVPSAQPEKRTEERAETHACDLIDRQAAIEIVDRYSKSHMILQGKPMLGAASIVIELEALPSAQPEIIRCKDCKWYGRADKRRFYRGMDCLKKRIDTIIPDKDFCSKAERREE